MMTPYRYNRRERTRIVMTLVVIGIVMGMGIEWLAARELREGQAAQAQQTELDVYGQETSGQITAAQTYDDKAPTYYLWYQFQFGEQRYVHYSSVTANDFAQVHVGDAVRVTYLPNKPEVSRAAQSTANAMAEEQILSGRVMHGLAWGLPFLFGMGGLVPVRRYHAGRLRSAFR